MGCSYALAVGGRCGFADQRLSTAVVDSLWRASWRGLGQAPESDTSFSDHSNCRILFQSSKWSFNAYMKVTKQKLFVTLVFVFCVTVLFEDGVPVGAVNTVGSHACGMTGNRWSNHRRSKQQDDRLGGAQQLAHFRSCCLFPCSLVYSMLSRRLGSHSRQPVLCCGRNRNDVDRLLRWASPSPARLTFSRYRRLLLFVPLSFCRTLLPTLTDPVAVPMEI